METDDVNTPAPLFSDPVHHAPTDPTLIQAPDGRWLMYYTQRRAADDGPAHTWVHGTDIAVASSRDGGTTWTYEGPVAGLDHLPGRNTLWAPEVIKVGDEFHMFLTHVPGVPSTWEGPRSITHLVSADLENWAFRSELGAVLFSRDRRLRLPPSRRRISPVVQRRGSRIANLGGRLPRPVHLG